MPIATYTQRLMDDLRDYGETLVTFDECRRRGESDSRAIETRARTRIHFAAARLRLRVRTTIVQDSGGCYVAGRVV